MNFIEYETQKIFQTLRSINYRDLTTCKSEKDFEDIVFRKLDETLDSKVHLRRQGKNTRDGREQKPDIVIGLNDILIELKFNLEKLNDIYRLFYQAIKYSKIAKQLLILFLYDPRKLLLDSDIEDLENIEKVQVIRII
ncbi:MAG: hypothetical protein ACOC44_07555 [Promethearchaeia archaeon]